MSKNYNAKQMRSILRDIVCNAFEHMESALKEVKKLQDQESKNLQQNAQGSKDLTQGAQVSLSPETQARLKVINITLTMINDIIHPAHGISYQFFKGYEPMIDLYIKNQQLAFEKGLVPVCYCSACDPDGLKSMAKAEEIRLKMAAEEKKDESVQGDAKL